MPIRVKCGSCKKTLSVKEHLAGKKIKCPVCQTVVTVPAASKEPASPGDAGAKADPAAPSAATKPKTKPTTEKPETNGAPSSNGPPAPPEPAALPPEKLEEEALSVFADQPAPPEEDQTPKTIDFKCEWCDEDLKLPIELAGKQTQCPNVECRRIIKVPLPKVAEKKDWRKMDRKGPAAALINQPEQLEDAWGTEVASQARQSSLIQAGAMEAPAKKPPDRYDQVRRALGWTGLALAGVLAIIGAFSLHESKQQQDEIKEIDALLSGKSAKITLPLLAAEALRTKGLLHLRSDDRYRVRNAQRAFIAAQMYVKVNAADKDVNEQLFLIDLALSQLELGGSEEDEINRAKISWAKASEDAAATLSKIASPEAQALALREVGSNLFATGQRELAIGLTSGFSAADPKGKRPIPYRQQIALVYANGNADAVKLLPPPPELNAKKIDSHVRVGYAEGYARKGKFGDALALVQAPGSPGDRLDAGLGVAEVALLDAKPEQAGSFVKEALNIATEKDARPTPWQLLLLTRLAARTGNAEAAKDLTAKLPAPFKLRADLELFLAQCKTEPGMFEPDKLADLESNEKKGVKKDEALGITLAIAWTALARHNARLGASRSDIRKSFDARASAAPVAANPDLFRPMLDIGSFQASLK